MEVVSYFLKSIWVKALAVLTVGLLFTGCDTTGNTVFYSVNSFSTSVSQAFQWVNQLGSSGKNAYSIALQVDSAGSTIMAGYTTANLVSCNGISTNCSGSSQGTYDYYITKYATDGTWLWTQQLGETGKTTFLEGITVDSSNNIYVAGYTNGNIVACAGVSGACGGGSSTGTDDIFISKYSSSGVWQWTKQFGETGKTTTNGGIVLDSVGAIYVTGYTSGNLVACSGISGVCGGGSSWGTDDFFVMKYNAAGTWQWTQQMGVSTTTTKGQGIAIDAQSNVYIGGTTAGNLMTCGNVTPCTTASSGVEDYFIAKYSSTGTFQWVTQLGQATKTMILSPSGVIATDSDSNVYLAGATTGNLQACAGVGGACGGLSAAGLRDVFVSSYSTNGTWIATKQLGQASRTTEGASLLIDSSNNIYLAGYTTGYIPSCTDGLSANCTGNSNGLSDYFLTKYSNAGAWSAIAQLGVPGRLTTGVYVGLDSSMNVFVGGQTNGNYSSCTGGIGANCNGPSTGGFDFYLVKY